MRAYGEECNPDTGGVDQPRSRSSTSAYSDGVYPRDSMRSILESGQLTPRQHRLIAHIQNMGAGAGKTAHRSMSGVLLSCLTVAMPALATRKSMPPGWAASTTVAAIYAGQCGPSGVRTTLQVTLTHR